MARSTDDIVTLMDDQQASETGLSSLNNPSQTSIYQLFKKVVAQTLNYFEQLVDTKKDEIDQAILLAPPATGAWLQNKIFEFQYSASNPQIIQLIDYAPQYTTVNEDLRVITRCSVTTDLNREVNIKVAVSDPPTALGLPVYGALYAYIDKILPVGLYFNLINLTADQLYVEANVYYDGQYIDVIQDNVEAAINSYLANLPFNGTVYISEVEDAIQSVTGVKDVRLTTIKARQDTVPLASAVVIYDITTGVNGRKWNTVAGYIVEENTAGNTFADKITYVVA